MRLWLKTCETLKNDLSCLLGYSFSCLIRDTKKVPMQIYKEGAKVDANVYQQGYQMFEVQNSK